MRLDYKIVLVWEGGDAMNGQRIIKLQAVENGFIKLKNTIS